MRRLIFVVVSLALVAALTGTALANDGMIRPTAHNIGW